MRYTVRHARPEDADSVRRLALLDSARPLRGDTMLALAGDRPVAAMSLADGRVVADPFRLTADAVARLRAHVRGGAEPRRARMHRLRAALA
jgi:hypothetical protein